MGPEWLAKFKDILSLSIKQVLIVAVAGWSLLFVPDDLMRTMGLANLRNQHRPWIGLAAWLSFAWLAAIVLYEVGDMALHRVALWRQVTVGRRLLEQLTPAERGYLALYVNHDTPTQTFRIGDGVVNMLEAKGIIVRPSSVGKVLDEFDFNIQPWAYQALKANPRLLAGADMPPPGFRRFT